MFLTQNQDLTKKKKINFATSKNSKDMKDKKKKLKIKIIMVICG